ncbi:beta-1,3-glucan-binding protein-like [Lutzomyia longipalpis]|uniref:beta-1,3-glucan-binding protein-like n=1 Tax=Lutzomyia longipalpis TaxID=7200 RepID=UPI002483D66D|nr:beta-1,3-glucan-binding protein-like [Lutzomyia longipalpis]
MLPMLNRLLTVYVIIALCFNIAASYRIQAPTFVVTEPTGLKVSIPDENGIALFAFHGKINEQMEQNELGTLYDDILSARDGRWIYENNTVALKKGDKIYYWIYVQHERLAYRLEDQVFEVTEYNKPTVITIPTPEVTDTAPQCELSRTTINGGQHICKNTLLFEDNFDALKLDVWNREVKFPKDTEDAEFCSYQDRPENSYVRDGVLYIVPTLQTNVPGFNESAIRIGKIDFGHKCTPSTIVNNDIECVRQGGGRQIIPPVVSAQLTSKNHFRFRYGKIVVRAKLPKGDWLFPEIWLKSSQNVYGDENFVNGLMRVAFIRSNEYLTSADGREIDGLYLRGMLVLDRGETNRERWMKTEVGQRHWGSDFHEYTLTWTDEMISMAVDGRPYAHFREKFCDTNSTKSCGVAHANVWENGQPPMAPFDQEVYVVLGVGVAGLSDFPEGCLTTNRHVKPWRNTDPRAEWFFYRDKDNWYPTWKGEDSGLQVDWVRVYSL